MKALVLYDSAYGNTAALAQAIAESLGNDTRAAAIGQVQASEVQGKELLVVGSPTQGGRPTTPLTHFLSSMPPNSLAGMQVAAFDTRFEAKARGFGLRFLMKVIGYAAPRIALALEGKGGRLAMPPEGFIVEDKEGPLKAGELERARAWGRSLAGEVNWQ